MISKLLGSQHRHLGWDYRNDDVSHFGWNVADLKRTVMPRVQNALGELYNFGDQQRTDHWLPPWYLSYRKTAGRSDPTVIRPPFTPGWWRWYLTFSKRIQNCLRRYWRCTPLWLVTKLEECCLGPGGHGSDFEVANPENGSYFVVVCSAAGQATTDRRS